MSELLKDDSEQKVKLKTGNRLVDFTTTLIAGLLLLGAIFYFVGGGNSSPYTNTHTIASTFSMGGLLPKFCSSEFPIALKAASHTIFGQIDESKKNVDDSIRHLKIARDAYKVLNSQNTVAGYACLSMLGRELSSKNDYAQAEIVLKEATESAKVAYGPQHELVALALRDQGLLFASQKKYAEAEKVYKEAYDLDLSGLGKHHLDVAYDMSCIAEMKFRQKFYAESIQYYKDSLLVWKENRGQYHPSFSWVEENLAKAYYESGDYAQAAREFEKSLARSDHLHGTHGKEYFRNLAWLSWSYLFDANPDRARIRATRLSVMLGRISDADVMPIIDVLESAADVFISLGEYRQAEELYQRLLRLQKSQWGLDDPRLERTTKHLAECTEHISAEMGVSKPKN